MQYAVVWGFNLKETLKNLRQIQFLFTNAAKSLSLDVPSLIHSLISLIYFTHKNSRGYCRLVHINLGFIQGPQTFFALKLCEGFLIII